MSQRRKRPLWSPRRSPEPARLVDEDFLLMDATRALEERPGHPHTAKLIRELGTVRAHNRECWHSAISKSIRRRLRKDATRCITPISTDSSASPSS